MKTTTKLLTVLTSLILVVGLAFALSPTETNADPLEIRDTVFEDRIPPCQGAPTNCACPIIVMPDE